MTVNEFANRLSVIERELAALKRKRTPNQNLRPVAVLDRIDGSFENDEIFQEAARLGRQWRDSDRKPKAKRK